MRIWQNICAVINYEISIQVDEILQVDFVVVGKFKLQTINRGNCLFIYLINEVKQRTLVSVSTCWLKQWNLYFRHHSRIHHPCKEQPGSMMLLHHTTWVRQGWLCMRIVLTVRAMNSTRADKARFTIAIVLVTRVRYLMHQGSYFNQYIYYRSDGCVAFWGGCLYAVKGAKKGLRAILPAARELGRPNKARHI